MKFLLFHLVLLFFIKLSKNFFFNLITKKLKALAY